MEIQVFGSGCPTCKKLYEMTKQAVLENGLNFEVKHITDVAEIVEMGLLRSPALVIDNEIAVAGRVPSTEELKEIIARHNM
ncbi:redox-active disulfide protein 2 [Candidatus Kuenenbacteria bacterium RIFCSPLOWO2_12_FULL_42_13]|uniref:Small redox-active disulfide protein 2 n=3 Tax=Candidatus Kueneniibacteriota TaxID=1752740 RepID=A0A0G0YZA1_9BACT|nr:MAG: Small redox-active disulfide protein 2 [Candidatus Kuenenbacteria bacterium GW2011_GWA2_42_15]OGG89632.1 MAG: redox-active disulfide protein 2 [Candidatus Kuenenbacteria bacterium RIFCSPHIGHO2_02_FULL_42_29]OGG90588.1 MAG: redox-active disulfide protein 2 [Candidatus Kuenenbacteria bacterium RIFCSPLOWO2_02_FULL_42_16]OGG91969.1 MAG: redox-active disulfide protein 2 [Candidatus Kuenenbacteria bacterium RIFCSPLOWO2_12_FULL_42_13]